MDTYFTTNFSAFHNTHQSAHRSTYFRTNIHSIHITYNATIFSTNFNSVLCSILDAYSSPNNCPVFTTNQSTYYSSFRIT